MTNRPRFNPPAQQQPDDEPFDYQRADPYDYLNGRDPDYDMTESEFFGGDVGDKG